MADDGTTATAVDNSRGAAPDETARAALAGAALPVDNLDDALPHLRRPFTPEAIKFKVQTAFRGNSGCIVVAYIDARLVVERLNAVVGGRWAPTYVRTANEQLLMCDLTVCGVTRPDIGASTKGLSKDLISDALKRSAVLFGVGVSVYALPQIKLYMRDSHGRIEVRGEGQRQTIALTEHGHVKLREGYGKWLDEHGERLFGPVLDHGDVVGETIDADAESDEDFTPALPEALTDERAVELTEQAKGLYAEIAASEEGRKAFPAARFSSWLEASAHSHAALEQLVEHVQRRRDEIVGGAS